MDQDVICTKDRPWDKHTRPKRGKGRVVHPDANEIRQRDGYPGGDVVDYECPNCGVKFSVELPQ